MGERNGWARIYAEIDQTTALLLDQYDLRANKHASLLFTGLEMFRLLSVISYEEYKTFATREHLVRLAAACVIAVKTIFPDT